ncbi:MAG: PEP-CTERM sorting domain-containing protein [Myxococcota bacterium]
MKTRTLLIASMVALSATAVQAQELVAGWDFSQYYTAGRLSTDGSTGVNTLAANYSSLDATGNAGAESAFYGTLLMDGTAGSTNVGTTIGSTAVVPTPAKPGDYDEATASDVDEAPSEGAVSANINGTGSTLGTNAFNSFPILRREGQTNAELLSLLAGSATSIVFQADPSAAAQSGSDWEVSFGGRAQSGGAANVGVSFAADCSSYGAPTVVALDDDDTAYSVDFGAGGDSGTACVKLDLGADAVIDNVAVSATLPEPSVAMGLLAGMGVMAGLRRSRRA